MIPNFGRGACEDYLSRYLHITYYTYELGLMPLSSADRRDSRRQLSKLTQATRHVFVGAIRFISHISHCHYSTYPFLLERHFSKTINASPDPWPSIHDLSRYRITHRMHSMTRYLSISTVNLTCLASRNKP